MSSESLGIILDIALVVMLSAALVYGFVLNRKINSLHQSRRELGQLFLQFDSTIVKAQKSVSDLKDAAKETSKQLQVQINEAGILINDLSYINDRAGSLANKLEGQIQQGRSQEFAPEASDAKIKRITSRTLPELRQAKQPITMPEGGSLKSPSTLETLLTKINQRLDRKKEDAPESLAMMQKRVDERRQPEQREAPRSPQKSAERQRAENMLKALGLSQNVS